MRFFRAVILAATLSAGTICAATGATVQEMDKMDDLTHYNATSGAATAVYLASYNCLNRVTGYQCMADGGEGLFIQKGTSCTPDGGSVVQDSAVTPRCWYRQNFNGDIRQYGVSLGSAYDCSPTTGSTSCLPIDTILGHMQTAAGQTILNIRRLTLSGMQVYLEDQFTLAAYTTLGGGASNPATSSFTDIPGTIWTGEADVTTHPQRILLGNHSNLEHLTVAPNWFRTMCLTSCTTIVDGYAIIANMVSKAQTGVFCTNDSCSMNNVTVAGFDTAVEMSGPGSKLDRVTADGNVCFYLHDTGAGSDWGPTKCKNLITSGGEEAWQIKAIGVGTGGDCRITLDLSGGAPPFSDIQNNFNAWVSGLKGTVGGYAEGRSQAMPFGTDQVDLSGTVCSPTSTTADAIAGSNVLRNVAAIANVRPGMLVSGGGIPSGATVVAVGYANGMVGISSPCTTPCTAAMSVTFSVQSVMIPPSSCTIHMGMGSMGPCFMLTDEERVDAGTSAGGTAAGGSGCATGYLIGGFTTPAGPSCFTGDTAGAEKVSGWDAYSPFCYAHAICYHLANAYHAKLVAAGMDAARNLDDDQTAFGIVDGNFKNLTFIAGSAGKVGSGLVIDPGGSDKGCVQVDGLNIGIYELVQGCLEVRGGEDINRIMVSDAASHMRLNGYSPGLDIFYENATSDFLASSATDTNGMIANSGSMWWGGNFPPQAIPMAASNIDCGTGAQIAGNSFFGHITVGSSFGTTCTLAFNPPMPNDAVCQFTDESSATTSVRSKNSNRDHVIFNWTGTLTAGDTVSYACGSWAS